MRFFTTEGPVRPDRHYSLPPLARWNLDDVAPAAHRLSPPTAFPQTVVLCGVRDYRIRASSESEPITGGSAFNVKAKSLRLGDFDAAETRTLLLEHTKENGQIFTPAALDRVWELTQGQPWLVNALAYRACFERRAGRDRAQPITRDLIDQAKEAMIVERVTHLDQLAHKLQEA